MSTPAHQSKILLTTLTECTSDRGTVYLRGWLGASNLVAFPGEPDEHGRPTWQLYLTERPPRDAIPADPGSAPPRSPRPRRPGPPASAGARAEPPKQRLTPTCADPRPLSLTGQLR